SEPSVAADAVGWSRSPRPEGHLGALRPTPLTAPSASYASYQSSTDCYHSFWADPRDAPKLDVAAYGAVYNCAAGTWTFPASTYDAWPASELSTFDVWIDSDGTGLTGCGGFEWLLQRSYSAGTAQALL